MDPYREFDDQQDDVEQYQRTLTIRDVIIAVRRRWWAVLAVLTLVVAVGTWRTVRQARLYQTAATVRFQQAQSPLTGAPMSGQRFDYRVDQLASEQILIKSTAVAATVVDELGLRLRIVHPEGLTRDALFGDVTPRVDSLARVGEYRLDLAADSVTLRSGSVTYATAAYGESLTGAGLTFTVRRRPNVPDGSVILEVGPRREAAQQVRGMISTRVLPSSDVVEITATGGDPRLVRDVANTIAVTYAEFSSQGVRENAETKSEFIAKSVSEQAEVLRAAQNELRRFQEANNTPDVTAEQAAIFETVHELEGQRRAVLVDQAVYESLLGKLQVADTLEGDLRRLVGTDAVARNQHIANLYERWFVLTKQRDSLMVRLTPGHEDVKAVDQAISRTKRELQDASALYLQALQTRLQALEDNIREARAQADRFPPLAAEQARLTANVRTMQATYDNLLAQYQLARINQSAETGTVRIIDEAPLPTFAVSPNRKRAVILAAAIGLLLGIGAAVLLEKLDDSIKSPEELQERLDIAVLGLIPAIRSSDVNLTAAARDNTAANRLVTHADPRSPVAESYRSLRTNLAFTRARQELRTIVMTSPGPADGKSTTVANLAITFAQQGQRTLLVDGDLRRAVIDKTFAVKRSPGLTDVLVGNVPLADAVQATEVPNLFVLTSGHLPPNPSELLGSPAMRQVVGEAKSQFDMVLFDSPPLLAVTDAAVLSGVADGTILIARMHKTNRAAVSRAMSNLRAVRAPVLGAVLNDVRSGRGGSYGGYGYYYYAYYGSESNGNGRPASVMDRVKRAVGSAAGRPGKGGSARG